MKIAIIGTGNVGSALAKGWSNAGHDILLGVRDQQNFAGKKLLSMKNCTVHSIPEAVSLAEVILVSVPPKNILEVAPLLKNVEEKIIIDPTNSFPAPPSGYQNCFEAWSQTTNCQHIVKAFNNTGYQNMLQPDGLDTFVAGNSEMAKKVAQKLAGDLGFSNCYDFGVGDKAGLLEQLAICWINMAYFQGLSTDFGFNIVRRPASN